MIYKHSTHTKSLHLARCCVGLSKGDKEQQEQKMELIY